MAAWCDHTDPTQQLNSDYGGIHYGRAATCISSIHLDHCCRFVLCCLALDDFSRTQKFFKPMAKSRPGCCKRRSRRLLGRYTAKHRNLGSLIGYRLCIKTAFEFIFNKSITIVLYELCALTLVTAATVGMNQFHTRVKAGESIKVAYKILAQAIPLMVVLFVLFPRIGPLWIFANDPPATEQLYWRGRVYANFDQGKWSEADIPSTFDNIQKINWFNSLKDAWFVPKDLNQNEKLSYTILMEPTRDKWLIGIDLALPKTGSTGLMWDYKLINRREIHSLLRYDVHSYPGATLNIWLPEFLRNQTTYIDTSDNPRTIAYAQNLYAQSPNVDTYVNNILDHIREQPYHYTLEPPTLKKQNSIDQFWFDTRQGFCSHYAGALVYMLRANNIPARMVGGYQGGETNPLTGHVVVRQYMAHAWVEYWQENIGWKRVDPTAAVAPSRIHDSLSAALPETDLESLSAFTNVRLNGVPGLKKVMFLFESLEHRWNLFILGYNSKRQSEFLEKLLGTVTVAKVLFVLALGAALSIIFLAFSLLRANIHKPKHPVIRIFQNFSNRLAKKGYIRQPQESATQFIENVAVKNKLAKEDYASIITTLSSYLYNPAANFSKDKLDSLQKELSLLQRKVAIQN